MPTHKVYITTDPYTESETITLALTTTDHKVATGLREAMKPASALVEIRTSYTPEELDDPDLHNRLVVNLMGAAAGDWAIRDVRTAERWETQMHLKPVAEEAKLGLHDRTAEPLAILAYDSNGLYGWRLTPYGFDWYRDTGCLADKFGDDLRDALDEHFRSKR
ncbi:hypothetical protein [Azospirillum sp. TSO5]|uniref:hypothetical protein n=1 Tax=Azospirillum sp. TSO5 TaxID=716760 RepID=UPI000D604DB3|nr:hypothetical protein [Azospirillum sp. TSO5]PWC98056.1 hypothetical protein TSO5_03380 [Azospirillum sp. TSO5]